MDIEKVRHSLSHILAYAVNLLFKNVKFGIGPTIENGFYYDFDTDLKEEDLKKIEEKMREILKQDLSFQKKNISKKEAEKLFKGQKYKLELIKELKGKTVSIYKSGDFTDLCKGPHVKSVKEINPDAFKLTHTAGAYWRGNEKNKMLRRVYGLAFETKDELSSYLKMIEEAEKRDHKKLGAKLELFMFHETAPGMPYFLPKGMIVMNELLKFWREEHEKRGYEEIRSPLMNKKELYELSGHWNHYRENMFLVKTEEGEIYGLKPMNCPNAMLVFKSKKRSYRELPLRLSDTDILHRYEASGTLNGLFRVREFSQDDAHIFVKEEDIEEEYKRIFEIIQRFYSIFNIKYTFRLSTKPKEFLGEAKIWNKAEKILEEILKNTGKEYIIGENEGAFYGPKIDILMKDSLGREWQTGTVQLDFIIPKRFNLQYTDKDGKEKTPVAIHRVIYGSLERFLGILIEHFEGALPFFLSPIQASVLPISEKHAEYGKEILSALKENKIRCEMKDYNETLSKRIRDAEIEKVPYLIIVGDKEIASSSLSVRSKNKDLGVMDLNKFISLCQSRLTQKN